MDAFNYQWYYEWMDLSTAEILENFFQQLEIISRTVNVLKIDPSKAVFKQLFQQLEMISRTVDVLAMNPSNAAIVEQLFKQLAMISREVEALENQFVQNTYYQHQVYYPSNDYPLGWNNYQNFSCNNYQDQFYTPELSYQSDFLYQPPPYQENKPTLEERLNRFLEHTEVSNCEEILNNCEETGALIRNLENQMGQLTNDIKNCPQDTLPNNIEFYPNEEGEELCEEDTLENGKEFQEIVDINLKRTYSDVEDDSVVIEKKSENRDEESSKDEDQAVNSNGINCDEKVEFKVCEALEIPSQFKECLIIDTIKDNVDEKNYFLPINETKFGGDSQSGKKVMPYKEKTTRRHEMIIFAVEPD